MHFNSPICLTHGLDGIVVFVEGRRDGGGTRQNVRAQHVDGESLYSPKRALCSIAVGLFVFSSCTGSFRLDHRHGKIVSYGTIMHMSACFGLQPLTYVFTTKSLSCLVSVNPLMHFLLCSERFLALLTSYLAGYCQSGSVDFFHAFLKASPIHHDDSTAFV